MPARVSKTTYDYTDCMIVPVIASFDRDGHVRPLYVGINGESLKVHSCWMKPDYFNCLDLNCKVIYNDCLKPVVLSYHKEEDIWTIPKPRY